MKYRQWVSGHKKDENLNFLWTQWCQYSFIHKLSKDITNTKIHNHVEGYYNLSNKKTMFMNMVKYYKESVFDTLPLTFHIQSGIDDIEFLKFSESFNKYKEMDKSIWKKN
jgi:hypothetical protein